MTKIFTLTQSAGAALSVVSSSRFNSPNNTAKTPLRAVANSAIEATARYLAASQSEATKRAYAQDIRMFRAAGGCIPCDPAVVMKYLVQHAEKLSVATLERRLTAIHQLHVANGFESPAKDKQLKKLMQGIRRVQGTKQRRVQALVKDDLIAALVMAERQIHAAKIARDRALLLVGFAGAFRRSELVAIRVEHITRLSNGIEIELPRSKTDQFGESRQVFIPAASVERRCPVLAIEKWLVVAKPTEGFVFRSVSRHGHVGVSGLTPHSVALIVKSSVSNAGGNSELVSGHSLRAGYVTAAAEAGLQPYQIVETTGHKSLTTLAKYIRPLSRRKIPSLL